MESTHLSLESRASEKSEEAALGNERIGLGEL